MNITSYRIVDDENHRVANVLREMEKFQRVGQNMLHKSGIIRVNISYIIIIVISGVVFLENLYFKNLSIVNIHYNICVFFCEQHFRQKKNDFIFQMRTPNPV